MPNNTLDSYSQSLLDRVVSLTKEINNLREAYIIVNDRLNHVSLRTEVGSKKLIEDVAKVEDYARLAVEAARLTEKSALLTKNPEIILAAQNSATAAGQVHELLIELRTEKLAKLKISY